MRPLTNIILKNEIRREKTEDERLFNRILRMLSFGIVFCTLATLMTLSSLYITKKLKEINQEYAYINVMLAGNFTILFFESIFQSLNTLYFSKDLRMILRMPIKPKEIVHGKLLQMIVAEYQMEIIMLAIPMIVYGILNNVAITYYLYIPAILLVLPIIPIAITSIIVAIIMNFVNKIKNKNAVMYLTIIISLTVLDIITSLFSGHNSFLYFMNKPIFTEKNGLAVEIANSFKLIMPTMESLLNYNNIKGILNLILYIVESGLAYIIAILVISPIYLKGVIGTVVRTDKKNSQGAIELNINDFKQKSYKQSYLLKEFLVIKRSPIFFIQCIIFPVFFAFAMLSIAVPLALITLLINKSILNEMLFLLSNSMVAGAFLTIIQILYMLNFSSMIAVSKEERGTMVCKYIPIKLSRQFNMKLFIGKIINIICEISIVILYLACTHNLLYTIFVAIIGYGLNTIGEKIKLLIDLKNPKIEWENEYQMMKKNTNALYELFYTIIVMGVLMLVPLLIQNTLIYLVVITFLTGIINMIINKYVMENDNKIFEKLY